MPYSEVPTIDLQPLHTGTLEGIQQVAEQMKAKFSGPGFAYVCNHGISEELINETYQQAKRFHALPEVVKLAIKQNDCFRGYMPNKGSQLKVSTEGGAIKPNQLTSFIMAFEVPETHPDYAGGHYLAGPNQWLNEDIFPGFKEVILAYRDALLSLAHKLLKVFSIAFGLEADGLEKYFVDPSYFLRLQYYPEQPKDGIEEQYGLAPHTDYGFFTLLSQDELGGLEVRLNGENWVSAPYKQGALLLNAGDMMQRWSNGSFNSIPHRVINRAGKARYSVPFFFEPNMHAMVDVLDSCCDSLDVKKPEPIMYGEYLLDRVQGNYNLGSRGPAKEN